MSRTRTLGHAAAIGLLAVSTVGTPAAASSHREAPMIARDPSADITDLYAFVSPDRPNKKQRRLIHRFKQELFE